MAPKARLAATRPGAPVADGRNARTRRGAAVGEDNALACSARLAWRSNPAGMYHAESYRSTSSCCWGECILIIDDHERHVRAWDFVHCPLARRTPSSERVTDRACSSARATGTSTTRRSGASLNARRSRCATAFVSSRTRARPPRQTPRSETGGASSPPSAGASSRGARARDHWPARRVDRGGSAR